jgi:hypothetical protein
LRRSQRPFHVVTITPALRQRVAVTDWFEIEAIDEFLLRLHVYRSENYFTESICDRFDSISPGKNLRNEVALSISLASLTVFTPSRTNDTSAPASGFPRLSRTVPVMVASDC